MRTHICETLLYDKLQEHRRKRKQNSNEDAKQKKMRMLRNGEFVEGIPGQRTFVFKIFYNDSLTIQPKHVAHVFIINVESAVLMTALLRAADC